VLSKRVCMSISLECQFEYTSTYWQYSIEGAQALRDFCKSSRISCIYTSRF
jgi:hypothetical protein